VLLDIIRESRRCQIEAMAGSESFGRGLNGIHGFCT
jgi:hypothetical protein